MDFTILQRVGIAVGGIISLVILSLLYEWARRELTTVKIGPGKLNKKLLKRGDYIFYNGRIYRFNHLTKFGDRPSILTPPCDDRILTEGNLACFGRGIDYIYITPREFRNIKYIYGEYGLKWAESDYWAQNANRQAEHNMSNHCNYYIGQNLKLCVDGKVDYYTIMNIEGYNEEDDILYSLGLKNKGRVLVYSSRQIINAEALAPCLTEKTFQNTDS